MAEWLHEPSVGNCAFWGCCAYLNTAVGAEIENFVEWQLAEEAVWRVKQRKFARGHQGRHIVLGLFLE